MEIGPPRGYFSEPEKSKIIVHPMKVQEVKLTFQELGLKVITGHRYLGGYIGNKEEEDGYLHGKVHDWQEATQKLAEVAKIYPQAAYSAMQRSLQQEWLFVQRVTDSEGPTNNIYHPIEKALEADFIPNLFLMEQENMLPDLRNITKLPVKDCGLALPDPTQTASANNKTSKEATAHLTQALLGNTEWDIDTHKETMAEAKKNAKIDKILLHGQKLQESLQKLTPRSKKVVERAANTGAWLSAVPNTLAGTELGKDEWRDSACIRYDMKPETIPKKCDGCGKEATVEHVLNCRIGGLIISRHNELKKELIDLGIKAFGTNSVRDEPLTNPTSDRNNNNPNNSNSNNSNRADIMIRGLWETGTDALIDVQLVNVDAKSHRNRDAESVLKTAERSKKRKHLADCQQQRRHFTPFVVSTDGMLGYEANSLIKRLAKELAEKWEQSYSRVCRWLKSRIGIAIVRATHRCLRGSRVHRDTMSLPHSQPTWEDGAGLHLSKW